MRVKFSNSAAEILALLSFMTEDERLSITETYYNDYYSNQDLIKILSPFMFPNLEASISGTPDGEFLDFNINDTIQYCLSGARKFRYQREILDVELASLNINVPYYFVFSSVSCLEQGSEQVSDLDLTYDECFHIVRFLETRKSYGVVPNCLKFPVKSEWILHYDLSQSQVIECLKQSKLGYIGISSALAVLAAKKYNQDSLIIKVPKALMEGPWFKFFFAPQTSNKFLHTDLLFL